MPDWVVILGIVLGLFFVSAFMYGIILAHKDRSQVFDYIIAKYQLSNYEVSGVTDRVSKEGKIHILDEVFIGKCSVTSIGIVFLQYGLKRDNALLFSWETVESFSISSDSTSATFTLPRKVGLRYTVEVPWSPELSLAKEQAM